MMADGTFPDFNGKATDPTRKSRQSRILSGADFVAGHIPPVWLIDGIVQRGRLYACTSLTGHGKTAVWLFNACMIHAGRMIGQLDVFQGNVLFLAGENPADLEARMIGMAQTCKLRPNQLPYVLPGSFPLTEQEADALKRDIAGLGVPLALIIGDTASSFFPGDDENSNVQAGTYARTLRGFNECDGNPAVVALCHPTKGAGRGNLLPRGGGAFLNELDGNLANWSHSPGEVTELHWCGKIRGPDFSALGYRLRQVPTGLTDEKHRPEMTIIAEPMSEEAVVDHTKQALANEDVVLWALHNQPGQSLASIAREAGWLDDNDQPEKWKVQRAIASLVEDKLIQKSRKGAPWELTDKGEKFRNKDNQ
jgi:AAA domain